MLQERIALAEQLDWANRRLRPEFKKVIRKFELQDFNELAQIGRSWEMARPHHLRGTRKNQIAKTKIP